MPVDPLQLIQVPLVIALAGLFLAALAYDLKTFRRRKSKDETIYRCADCRLIYIDIHRTPLARCPTCGKQNEPIRQR